MKKIEFHDHLAPGDILMMTCAIRDFKTAFPDQYLVKVDTLAMHIWDNNPYLSNFDTPDQVVKIGPKRVVQGSNTHGLHYANGFRLSIEQNLNITFPQGPIKPDLHLTDVEKKDRWIDGRYWLITTGGKSDFTSKIWPADRWQKVVDALPHITFVQIGEKKHNHPLLTGPNIINLVGSTENPDTGLRDLFKLFYHCDGSLGLVSMQMHLAAAFDKACVVVAGAREPASFEAYNHHRYLHNQGAMRCKNDCTNCISFAKDAKGQKICSVIGGKVPSELYNSKKRCTDFTAIDPTKIYIQSCWRRSVDACTRNENGYAKCILMVQPEDVIRAVNDYYEGGALPTIDPSDQGTLRKVDHTLPQQLAQPFPVPTNKIFRMVCNAHAYIGGERSTVWIMNKMVDEGYHVQLVPTKTVCNEFRQHLNPAVEVTNHLTAPCEILMIYANDMVWEFEKPQYNIMHDLQADRKILMLNYKLGGAGKADWTRDWDQYGFLCSEMRENFKKRVPDAHCFVLPPAVDIEPFLAESISYNKTLHLIRHSSQGDSKYPKDTNEFIEKVRAVSPTCMMSFMPGPSFLNGHQKVHSYRVNELPVVEFLKQGTCFWYRLPPTYSDQGPRTIVEAMALGLPVIADNRWGAKDRVTEDTGWLCDTDDDYIQVISTLNHNILRTKGEAAKIRASEQFDPMNWIRTITGKNL